VLYYDYQLAPTPEVRAELDWMIKQFAKINVQLEIRATDFNQFQDKLRKGRQQIFLSGWNADYPDAENFLTLLYGPNAKVSSDGDNTANYSNPEFDKLLAQLKFMDDGPAKQVAIDKMVKIVQEDAIWSWGYFPYSSGAFHKWVHNTKPTSMVLNLWQYVRIDAAERERSLHAWNRPIYWPLVLLVLGVLLLAMGAIRVFKAREQRTALPVVDGSAA
jgi:ABC-type transport system substrate-binding protein